MSWRRGLTHWLGLALLLISVVLGVGVAVLVPSAERAIWLVAWGLLAYGAVVIVVGFRRPRARTPARREPGEPSWDEFVRLTEDALRRLNSPTRPLGECGLIARIPVTLVAERGEPARGNAREPTQLEQARALRSVLESAIERLKPEGAAGEAAVLQYAVLHEEYVLGRPNSQIMTRHGMSESTFHRYRREGIRVVAGELAMREDLLSRDRRGQR